MMRQDSIQILYSYFLNKVILQKKVQTAIEAWNFRSPLCKMEIFDYSI